MEKRKGKSRKPLGKLNAKPSITVDNLTQMVSKQKAAQLPGVLKDLYGSTVSKIEFYHDSGTIKKLVDGYVAKLNEYYAKVSKPAIPVRKTEPKKAETKKKPTVLKKVTPKFKVGDYVKYETGEMPLYTWQAKVKTVVPSVDEFLYRLDAYGNTHDGYMSELSKSNEQFEAHLKKSTKEDFEKMRDRFKASTEKYKTKQTTKPAHAKKPVARKQQPEVSLVAQVSPEVRFIKRYLLMDGKRKTRKQLLAFINSLQRAIEKKQIRKTSKYAKEIMHIQNELLAIHNNADIGEAFTFRLDKTDNSVLEKYRKIAGSQKQRASVRLISRYVGIHGKTAVKEKAERLLTAVKTAFRKHQVPAGDPYVSEVKKVQQNLEHYLKAKEAKLTINKVDLKGLQGIVGDNRKYIGKASKQAQKKAIIKTPKLVEEEKIIKNRVDKLNKLNFEIIALAREAINNRDKFPLINDFDLLAPLSRKELANSKYQKNFYQKYNDLYNERRKYLIKMGEFSLKAEEYFISLKSPLSDEENDFLQKVLYGNRQDWFNKNSKLGLIKHNHPIKKGDKVLSPFGERGTVVRISNGIAFLDEFPGKSFKAEFLQLTNTVKKHNANRRKEKKVEHLGVITATQLSDIDYETFGFIGKWKSLIGDPSKPFSLMFWSKPGLGKSTLAIELSKYLASKFNQKVLFVAAEEGLSYTLKEKFTRLNALDDNIFILPSIPDNLDSYDVIVIDSVTRLKMSPDEFLSLKERYPHKSFILVFQATVDGNYRGSKEFEHEVDVSIFINDNGYAKVSKGRFGGDGTLKVFSGTPEHIYRFTLLQDAEKFVANRKDEKLRMVEGDDGKIWVTNEDKAKDLKKSGYVIL